MKTSTPPEIEPTPKQFSLNLKKRSIQFLSIFLLIGSIVLLLPWRFYGPASLMAGDGPPSLKVDIFIWSGLTYPLSVVIAAIFIKRAPLIAILPWLHIAVWLIAGG